MSEEYTAGRKVGASDTVRPWRRPLSQNPSVWKRLAAGLLVTAVVLGAGELAVRVWAPDFRSHCGALVTNP